LTRPAFYVVVDLAVAVVVAMIIAMIIGGGEDHGDV
jgi:hypothetical protein